MRLIAPPGSDAGQANVEIKCFDLSANPYLVTGAVLAVALAGAGHPASLPPEVSGDPATPGHPQAHSAVRLPTSLADTVKALEESADLRGALGEELLDSYAAARRAAITLAAGQRDEQVIAEARWLI